MSAECPVNTVDEHAARTVAAIVVVLAVGSLWEPARLLTGLLAVDFTIRGFVNRRYSPLRWIAKQVTGALGLQPKPVYAPPKRFAARIGSALTLAAFALHLLSLHAAAVVVTMLLAVAASLEAGAGFCIACWVYPYVFRLRGESA